MPPEGPIDISFDVRSDTPPGKDPDYYSPTLRRYHQLLWSKPLPGGGGFDLTTTTRGIYLHHHSELGEFGLSSDTIIHSYSRWPKLRHIIEQIPSEETEEFIRLGSTIGAKVVFPGFQVDGKMTINQHRGCHPSIRDRFDLTLECIRRHYANEPSPLSATLSRYGEFFALFRDFEGYVDFFLLQDLVDAQASIRWWMPFDDFVGSPVPEDLETYVEYRAAAMEFVEARNRRIAAWAREKN